MHVWIAVALVVVAVLWLKVAPRLFPIAVGKAHIRKYFDSLDEHTHALPRSCLKAFARDALNYARQVTAAKRESWEPKVYFWIEYERMLKVHAFACHALLNRLNADAVAEFEKKDVAAKLEKDILRGIGGAKLMKRGHRYTMEQPTNLAAHAQMLRDAVGAFDMDTQRAAAELAKSGRAWEPQRAVLQAAGLLAKRP